MSAPNKGLSDPREKEYAWADLDQDGWTDFVVVRKTPFMTNEPRTNVLFMNEGERLVDRTDLYAPASDVPGDEGFETKTNDRDLVIVDIDGDGWLDVVTDESAWRMTVAMLQSGFGTSAEIADMNSDSVADIVKNTEIGQTQSTVPRIDVLYNDPGNEGSFNIRDAAYGAAPYHANVGDLNQDGKPDIVASDDFEDRDLLNQGNDPLGRVIWSPPHVFGSPENTFSTTSQIADIDGDGWNDVMIADMDPIFLGCNRRLKIYHHRGGAVGGFVDLTEGSGNGWTAVAGLTVNELKGTWDIAVFDVDGDTDSDLVIGRYNTTEVWVNQRIGLEIGTVYCDPAVPNSTGQPATITATGSNAVSDDDVTLRATSLSPDKLGYFIVSQTTGFVSNPGGSQGNLCLGGGIGRYALRGELSLRIARRGRTPGGPGRPARRELELPGWYRDRNPQSTSGWTRQAPASSASDEVLVRLISTRCSRRPASAFTLARPPRGALVSALLVAGCLGGGREPDVPRVSSRWSSD